MRKSVIARNEKRKILVEKYAAKREAIKKERLDSYQNGDEMGVIAANQKLNDLPKDSVPCRVRNRCSVTGRARGYRRMFGLSRNQLREIAYKIPGIVKI